MTHGRKAAARPTGDAAQPGGSAGDSHPDGLCRDDFDEQWRVACPAGHVRLEPSAATETAYCETCAMSYDWAALVDRKRTAQP